METEDRRCVYLFFHVQFPPVQSDASLTEAYKAGRSSAFEELYLRHVRPVFHHVYSKTHHRETTEDIVSQTFLQAMDRIQSFDALKGSFAGWLHRIAENLVIDHFRKFRPTEELSDIWDLPSECDVPKDVSTTMKVQHILREMQSLKPKQRSVILLRVWHGYTFAEIADMLEMSEPAVKMLYGRSVKVLKSALLFFLLLFLLPSVV